MIIWNKIQVGKIKNTRMKKMTHTLLILAITLGLFSCESESGNEPDPVDPVEETPEAPLEVGYALSINHFTPEVLSAAKAAGVDHVEASAMSTFIDSNADFRMTEEEAIAKLTEAKKNADAAGINIWSIHMPFGEKVDISVTDEAHRQKTVANHSKLVEMLEILDPEIILFHPSWYLGLNQRDERKSQLLKSATELDEAVRAIGATMVLENMLGPELLASGGRERPLMRTVEETKEIFSRLPSTIGLGVDTNHIGEPEKLIKAMGDKLKTLHIADGTARAENHFFPCTGEGENDWNKILAALEEVGYEGPFMYESPTDDVKNYRTCYEELFETYYQQK